MVVNSSHVTDILYSSSRLLMYHRAARKLMTQGLMVGTAEIDITPPLGTPLCGSFAPRESKGIEDPLLVKAMVLESAGRKLAYVILDPIALSCGGRSPSS
jgi:hypothetical protein